ncbi:MAG: MG2 domain-containing protein [Polyangiaceae bacterium]|nr:MG2 domain-containing protein [Polyangiaceae bacterium]
MFLEFLGVGKSLQAARSSRGHKGPAIRRALGPRRSERWLGLVALVVLACAPQQRVSAPVANPGLSLAQSPKGDSYAGPFRVVFAGPKGEASAFSQLQVVFSTPLQALDLAEGEKTPQLRLTPEVPGRWQMVGTRALIFAPTSGRLREATHYVVTIPREFKSLTGEQLPAEFRWDFSTPRPKLVSSDPSAEARGVTTDKSLELRFNQPIALETLKQESGLFAITAGKLTPLEFSVSHPRKGNHKLLLVKPNTPLPVDSRIELRISDKLGSLAGPLLSARSQTIGFFTYGPLRVEFACSRQTPKAPCEAGSAPWLDLSNPIKAKDLRQAVRIEPPVKLRWDSWQDENEPTSWVGLSGPFAAGQTYTLSLDPNLRDIYGQRVVGSTKSNFTFGDYPPTLAIGVEGEIFEPEQSSKIPISSVNLKRYRVTTVPLTPKNVADLDKIDETSQKARLLRALPRARTQDFQPPAVKNRPDQNGVELASSPTGSTGARRGPMAILTEHIGADRKQEHQLRILQITDLALTAKLSTDTALVWVTRLSTGAPVANAAVEVQTGARVSKRYFTNPEGFTEVPASELRHSYNSTNDQLLVARTEDDLVVRHAENIISPWRFDVPADYSGQKPYFGVLFTERGLYRPGDAVKVKGIVRREAKTGNDILPNQSFDIVAEAPDGQNILRQKVTTSSFGTFDLEVRLPLSAALGSYSLRTDGLAPGGLYETFSVAEYQPAEFKVGVESSKPSYQRGERASFTVTGDYLYGAPMNGAKVSYRASRNPTHYVVPQSAGLITDASAYDADLDRKSPGFSTLKEGNATLDAQGHFALPIDLALPGQTEPEAISVDAEVTDVSRQAFSAGTTSIVHPARFYLGLLEPKNYFVDAPGTLTPEFAAIDPGGARVAGRNVTVELVRRRFSLVREQKGDSYGSTSRAIDEVVSTCTGVTTNGLAKCELKVPDAGYFLVLARAKDGKGQEARAAYSIYGIGSGQAWWPDSDDQKLSLSLDKAQYKVGERARLLIKSPFPQADAIITVERAGVYEKRRIHVSGATPTVTIPVTDAIRPNAYISVELVRPRTAPPKGPGKPDLGAPTFRLGYVELKVDAEARRLNLDIKPNRRDYRPGEDVVVDLAVKTAAGKPHPAEVTLYAVDEGVLSLINYHAPDPLKVFMAPRALQVATLESREALARLNLDPLGDILGLQKGAEGGGGGEGSSSVRRDFRQSVYFNPTLAVGPEGMARVSFKLPDTLTSFRLMAVAAALDDRYGFAETNITTSKPLMARPALPRFLRIGDNLEAGVVVSAKNFGPAEVSVKAQASGISLLSQPLTRVALGRNESKEVRFKFRADQAGSARFNFTASTDKERDAVEVNRRVETPTNLETVALYGETRALSREQLGNLGAVRRDVGGLTVTASSTALVGLDAGMSQLLDYPYACTEQLSSRILPLLPLRDLAREFGFALPPNADALIERTVAEIVSRQRGDGGFGLWPESSESSPWVSPYALWVLFEAKQRGVKFGPSVLERGTEYLRQYLAHSEEDKVALASQAFMVDVLALLGKPDVGYMTRLAQRADLPSFAKALVLHALVTSKQPEAAQTRLIEALENSVHITENRAFSTENLGDDYASLMDSEARTTALLLRALVAARPDHPLGARLARGLLLARKGGSWRTTQETAFALLALNDYQKAAERDSPDAQITVTLGQNKFLQHAFAGRSSLAVIKELPMAAVNSRDLTFQQTGRGVLFYAAELRYALKEPPKEPLDRGFFVQKSLRKVTSESLGAALLSLPEKSQTTFAGGDLVVTDLLIVTGEPREYVVLDDRLAAGMEAVDTNLVTTAAWLTEAPSSGFGNNNTEEEDYEATAEGSRVLSVPFRQELRDDRALFFMDHLPPGIHHFRYLARATTLGRFVVPPTQAEEMYSPENFGRTGATVIEVR